MKTHETLFHRITRALDVDPKEREARDQRALFMQRQTVEQLQRVESGVIDHDHLEILEALSVFDQTPGMETSVTYTTFTREHAVARSIPKRKLQDKTFQVELGRYMTDHEIVLVSSDFWGIDHELPRFMTMDYKKMNRSTMRLQLVFLEQLPGENTMESVKAEILDKGIAGHLDEEQVALAREGVAFSIGNPKKHTYQCFELWNTVEVNGRRVHAFLSRTEVMKPRLTPGVPADRNSKEQSVTAMLPRLGSVART